MGTQNLKSKMKLSITLVFLTFALTIDAGPPGLHLKPAGPPGLYLKPAGPPGLYLKPIDGRQQLEQTRGDEESLAMNRKGREYFKKKYGNIPSQKTRADEVDGSALEGKDRWCDLIWCDRIAGIVKNVLMSVRSLDVVDSDE